MHQPFYKNLWTGEYQLPWTRLHALKDYAGMVEILAEFPHVRQTFNLVPSMVLQIDEYATGKASDPFFDCAVLPAEDLNGGATRLRAQVFLSGQRAARFPSLSAVSRTLTKAGARKLLDTGSAGPAGVESTGMVRPAICWRATPRFRRCARRAAIIRSTDQALMARKQREALGRVLPVYREFAARGQIEISTTPFFHPILPLVCDSKSPASRIRA